MQINTALSNQFLASQAAQYISAAQGSINQNSSIETNQTQLKSQPAQAINFSQIQGQTGTSAADQTSTISNQSATHSATQTASSIDQTGNTQNTPAKKNDPTNNQNSVDKSAQQKQAFEQVIKQLKARDTEVRAHEMAHLVVAGQYARGMSFTYQQGPDGKNYAIGGEVGIDVSAVSGDPEATIEKMRIVQQAAMAPAQPSSQDYKVAQSAAQTMTQAMAEVAQAKQNQDSSATEETEDINASGYKDISENNGAHNITPNNQDNSQTNGSITPASNNSINGVQNPLQDNSVSVEIARQQFETRVRISEKS